MQEAISKDERVVCVKKEEKQSYFLAIDLKSFYASVECVERDLDPLTTNLVVADASRTSKTICLAVTPSLKAYGLSGRCRLFEVEQKVQEIKSQTGEEITYHVAVPRMALYEKYSADIYGIYLNYVSSEDVHVYSIDEVFIDVTRYLALYQTTPHQLAKTMLREVYERTGITGTAGIGTNLYLAKIAMDIGAKHIPPDEDGVRIKELDEMAYRKEFWGHMPLTDFWRVGRGTARRLIANGMRTMGDVARMSTFNEELLYRIFGIDAEILIDHAWGYEPCTMENIKAYRPRTNCFSSGQVLMCPYSKEKAKIVVREMTEAIVLELVDKEFATPSFTLTVGYDRECVDGGDYRGEVRTDHYGRTVPVSAHATVNLGTPSSSTKKITTAILKTYDEIVDEKLLVRRITLCANQVVERGYEQFDLLTDSEEIEKERRLQKAMLDIQKRFGKNSILKGTDLQEGATMRERNEQIGGHKA